MAARGSSKRLTEAIEALRVLCPTEHPVEVRRVKMSPDDFGYAEFVSKGRKHFKVRINSTLPADFQLWVLIHEWAHCMTWNICHRRHDDHGAHFGVAYSEAYNAIYS